MKQLPLVKASDPIRHAISVIDRLGKGIAVVVDEESRVIGTITDGDVRRAVLSQTNMDAPVEELLKKKSGSAYPIPVTARVGASRAGLLQLLKERVLRQVPIVDERGRIVDLVMLDELLPADALPVNAVIMAGGKGSRLFPLTKDTPKPLLHVGEKPLMEHIVQQLRDAGIKHVHVATHYLADKIVEHFGDGSGFGVELTYVEEDRPLGTAGALNLVDATGDPLLVINGDVLTTLDFRAFHAFHRQHKADMTVAVRKYDLSVPYGVIENDGVFVKSIVEKPVQSFLVNAGVYLLEPSVMRHIPAGERSDMTDLIHVLLRDGGTVVNFPVIEYWLDVGQHGDYEKAQEDVKKFRK